MTIAAQTARTPMPNRIRRVLMIDDEKFDQMVYRRVLDRSGLVDETIMFLSAEDALDWLSGPDRKPVDVVFLDINMPRMNGFEFLDAAHDRLGPGFAAMVVVMLTTSLNPTDRQRAEKYDVVKSFLTKPLTVSHVRETAELLVTMDHSRST